MEESKPYGRTVSNNQVEQLVKYYSFATPKQKLDIKHILAKDQPSDKEYKRLIKYIFKLKMYLNSNTSNVDARLNKIKRSPITSTGYNNKLNQF